MQGSGRGQPQAQQSAAGANMSLQGGMPTAGQWPQAQASVAGAQTQQYQAATGQAAQMGYAQTSYTPVPGQTTQQYTQAQQYGNSSQYQAAAGAYHLGQAYQQAPANYSLQATQAYRPPQGYQSNAYQATAQQYQQPAGQTNPYQAAGHTNAYQAAGQTNMYQAASHTNAYQGAGHTNAYQGAGHNTNAYQGAGHTNAYQGAGHNANAYQGANQAQQYPQQMAGQAASQYQKHYNNNSALGPQQPHYPAQPNQNRFQPGFNQASSNTEGNIENQIKSLVNQAQSTGQGGAIVELLHTAINQSNGRGSPSRPPQPYGRGSYYPPRPGYNSGRRGGRPYSPYPPSRGGRNFHGRPYNRGGRDFGRGRESYRGYNQSLKPWGASTSANRPPPTQTVPHSNSSSEQGGSRSYRYFESEERDGRLDQARPWTSYENVRPKRGFTMMSYNVLSESNSFQFRPYLYQNRNPKYMEWRYRRQILIEEIAALRPDILCLQEVDSYEEFQNALKGLGYRGLHCPRTGTNNDGCSTFVRSAICRFDGFELFRFSEKGLRDNVALLTKVRFIIRSPNYDGYPVSGETTKPTTPASSPLPLSQPILVANTHLLFNPKRGDIKFAQAVALMQRCAEYDLPTILAGDFNFTPESLLYDLFTEGRVNCATLAKTDRVHLSGQIMPSTMPVAQKIKELCDAKSYRRRNKKYSESDVPSTGSGTLWEGWEGTTASVVKQSVSTRVDLPMAEANEPPENESADKLDVLSQLGPLKSCYGSYDDKGEAAYTTFHDSFVGCLDYIFHTVGLKCCGVLEVVRPNAIARLNGLPSFSWPSDHLALVSHFIVDGVGAGVVSVNGNNGDGNGDEAKGDEAPAGNSAQEDGGNIGEDTSTNVQEES